MRIGAFEIVEPLPVLREPHAVAMLRPWVDAGNVGALALLELERQFPSRPLATLARPGTFYDLTRYRPTVYVRNGKREISVPNTVVSVASPLEGPDLVVIKMLEPHMFAESYVKSMMSLLNSLGVKRYVWVGSMYDMVPHTRPLLVTGGAVGSHTEADARRLGILPTDYQGPTTMTFEIVQRAPQMGMETMWCIVHLPRYMQMEEDYVGKVRLLEVLQGLYDIEIDVADIERALEQTEAMDHFMSDSPDLTTVMPYLEAKYEGRMNRKGGDSSPLPPDVAQFLNELGRHGDGSV